MSQETLLLSQDQDGIARAAELLRHGGRVAFPTETVYGLGADARNGQAVAGIFEAKGRPRFNPLIVHLADIEQAKALVVWNEVAEQLAQAFWPGPMTLVLPLKPQAGLSDLVTADLPNLGLRVPANPVGQALLRAFGGPVAAPSANPSGRISPTTAAHVMDGLNGRIEGILDGGPCQVGLESTIIGLTGAAMLLRPGGLSAAEIETVLGHSLTHHQAGDTLTAPGQMASHYAPAATVRLEAETAQHGELHLGFGAIRGDLNLSESGDLKEAAANLFACLHQLDAKARPIAVAPIPQGGLGAAINDRLRRAAAPR